VNNNLCEISKCIEAYLEGNCVVLGSA
jgi:hypothetical protein